MGQRHLHNPHHFYKYFSVFGRVQLGGTSYDFRILNKNHIAKFPWMSVRVQIAQATYKQTKRH